MSQNSSWMREAMALEYAADTGEDPYDLDEDELDAFIVDTVSDMGVMDYVRSDNIEGWKRELEEQLYSNEDEKGRVGFRFNEIANGDPLNCLGMAVGMATFNRQTGDALNDEYVIHYDKMFDGSQANKQVFDLPHISATVGGVDVLDPGDSYENNERINRSQLADMYGIGLAAKVLQADQDVPISNSDMIRIGKNALTRNERTSESEYIKKMAIGMIDDFENKKQEDEHNIIVG